MAFDVAGLLDELGPAPVVARPKDLIAADAKRLWAWLQRGGRAQQQLKPRRHEIMRSRLALLQARAELGDDPGYGHFAHYLAKIVGGDWSKERARTRLNMLRRLEEAGGPWAEGVI